MAVLIGDDMRARGRPRHEQAHALLRQLMVAAVAVGLAFVIVLVAAAPAQAAVASNDRIADATTIGMPALVIANTIDATTELGEPVPTCAPPGVTPIRRTVWYKLRARGTVLRVTTAGSGTNFRPILAIYQRAATGGFVQVGCGNNLSVSATVIDSQSYYLQVGGAGLPGNDDAGRVSLLVGPVTGGPSGGGGGPTADLTAAITDAPDPVVAGSDITYVVTVNNAGPSSISPVTTTVTSPSTTTFRSVTAPSLWACTSPDVGASGPVTCSGGNLSPGTPDHITVVVRVNSGVASGATIVTTASVSASGSTDPTPSNNSASVTTTVTSASVGLTLIKAGPGSGTVTSGDGKIDCGSTCSASYAVGSPASQVTLTATPAAGSSFAGWSGGCSGSGACQVTLDAAKSVTATFQRTNVGVIVAPAPGLRSNGDRILAATLTARPGCGSIDHIQFGEPGTAFDNALVSISSPAGGPSNQASGFTFTPPPGTTSASLTFQRIVPSGGATVNPIRFYDQCGEWRTFVGGGNEAFK